MFKEYLTAHREKAVSMAIAVIVTLSVSLVLNGVQSDRMDQRNKEAIERANRDTLNLVQAKLSEIAQEEVLKAKRQVEDLKQEKAKIDDEILATRKVQIEKLGVALENVSLDKLEETYREVTQRRNSFSFQTARGVLSFSGDNVSMEYVPSIKKLASLKMGKKGVTENEELVKAWIDESEMSKISLGYLKKFKVTRKSTYGEVTEGYYTKGDSYMKTYFQYERVQGTYARHSLQYTYFVEVGSDQRKKQSQAEQYNKKLGS